MHLDDAHTKGEGTSPCRADKHHRDAYPGEREVVMLEQSIDTQTLERDVTGIERDFPSGSSDARKDRCAVSCVPRMERRTGHLPAGTAISTSSS